MSTINPLLVLDGILGITEIFKRLKGNKTPGKSITLTSINLRFGSDVHALQGMEFDKEEFELKIPFKNTMGSGLLPDNLKGPEITIKKVSVDSPFQLVGLSPETPLSVGYLESTNFNVRLRSPSPNYTGPVTVSFETDTSENVNIDLNKVVLIKDNIRREIEDTAANMILKKSQIIRRDIQVYKILKYNQAVSSVKANPPFEIVSSEPAAPFTIDRKDSYVIKLFIKCPDFNYAGPLEITFM